MTIEDGRFKYTENAVTEALLLEGLASKRLPMDADFWKRLEAKTEAIIKKHSARKTT